MHQKLAHKEGLGCVAMCKDCKDVHIAIDSLTMRITPDAFVALSEMIQEAMKHPKLAMAQENPQAFMAQQLFSLA